MYTEQPHARAHVSSPNVFTKATSAALHQRTTTTAPPPHRQHPSTTTATQPPPHHHCFTNTFAPPPQSVSCFTVFLFSLYSCFPFCPFSCFSCFSPQFFSLCSFCFLSDRSYCTSILPLNFILSSECSPTECSMRQRSKSFCVREEVRTQKPPWWNVVNLGDLRQSPCNTAVRKGGDPMINCQFRSASCGRRLGQIRGTFLSKSTYAGRYSERTR